MLLFLSGFFPTSAVSRASKPLNCVVISSVLVVAVTCFAGRCILEGGGLFLVGCTSWGEYKSKQLKRKKNDCGTVKRSLCYLIFFFFNWKKNRDFTFRGVYLWYNFPPWQRSVIIFFMRVLEARFFIVTLEKKLSVEVFSIWNNLILNLWETQF